ncbi:GPI mannosyltransferase 1 [Orbilia ellipsospora]|uniref:GPI mannosyltransferase 1 n=1 Tax=Orbilia ellipsospora TaxID=2528407 RepID=A0AAV9XA33_9PEZI
MDSPDDFDYSSDIGSILILSTLLRVVFLFYGLYQDATSVFKYTDIDYLVFTDAARYVANASSPYLRATYRYTPLLSWLLVPTTFQPQFVWFSFGKVLFAAGDILAGYLIIKVLQSYGFTPARAIKYSALWLLNPMVATISTRGSSEGLLGVTVIALLWATEKRQVVLSGAILGFAVHFKIYPFIYAPSIILWMQPPSQTTLLQKIKGFVTKERIIFSVAALSTFMILNLAMYAIYGHPFIVHTFLHHLTRLDHRHNFSPYNTLLYLKSSPFIPDPFYKAIHPSSLPTERLAFIPQILLSAVVLPLFATTNLPSTMFAQTFAFVTFNKVVTSQYFMWYLVLLPFYLPHSSLLRNSTKGIVALVLWVATQGAWLGLAYGLEFEGANTFWPGLWGAAAAFFIVNCWILGVAVGDIGKISTIKSTSGGVVEKKEETSVSS